MKNFYEMSLLLEYNYIIRVGKKIQDGLFDMYLLLAKLYHVYYHNNVIDPEHRKSLEDEDDIKRHSDYLYNLPHDHLQKELLKKFGPEKMASAAKAKNFPVGRFARSPFSEPVDIESAMPYIIEKINSYLKSIKDEWFLLKHEKDFSSEAMNFVSDINNISRELKQNNFDKILDNIKKAEQDIIDYINNKVSGGMYSKITRDLEKDPTRWTSGRY